MSFADPPSSTSISGQFFPAVQVERSTISGNSAHKGGGMYATSLSHMFLTESHLDHNSGDGGGGLS